MTTYRAISDTEVAVDAPLTQQLMQGLKDNQLAINEGASGAPRQSHLAIGNVEAGEKPIIYWARNTGFNGSSSSTSYDYYSKTWTVGKCGTYRFKIMAQGQDSNLRCETRLYKMAAGTNTSEIILTTTGGAVSTAIYNQADITLATGDRFYLRNARTDGNYSGRRFSRLIVSVLQPLANFCESFEIGIQGSYAGNNNYDSRHAHMGDGHNGTSIPFMQSLEDYGLSTTDSQWDALDLTATER